jgi:hypothetical protein
MVRTGPHFRNVPALTYSWCSTLLVFSLIVFGLAAEAP